jgi:P-type conjugative transfer protein TrbL
MKTNMLDGALEQIERATAGYGPQIQTIALGIFGMLGVLSVVWNVIQYAAKNNGQFTIAGVFFDVLLRNALYFGFWGMILATWTKFSGMIFNGFRFIGVKVSGPVAATPSQIVESAMDINKALSDIVSVWHPGDLVAVYFAGIVIIVCFAFTALFMVAAVIEMYVAVYWGSIFVAFSGLSLAGNAGAAVIQWVVSAAAKLLAMQLLITVLITVVAGWVAELEIKTWADLGVMIMASVMLAGLTWQIPKLVGDLIGGIHRGGDREFLAAIAGTMIGVAKAGSLVAGGASAAAGAGRAVGQTSRAVTEARREAEAAFIGPPAPPPATRAARLAQRLDNGVQHVADMTKEWRAANTKVSAARRAGMASERHSKNFQIGQVVKAARDAEKDAK